MGALEILFIIIIIITALQSDSCVEVKFMHPTAISGHYKLPDPDDIAAVDIAFMFACPIDSPLLNSSDRVYVLQTAKALLQDYLAFKLRCLFDSPLVWTCLSLKWLTDK